MAVCAASSTLRSTDKATLRPRGTAKTLINRYALEYACVWLSAAVAVRFCCKDCLSGVQNARLLLCSPRQR